MKSPIFTGVCTALVTPFLNNEVNYPMLEQLLRRQLDAGIHAVVICGTTGESPTLSDQEKLTLFRRCKDFVGERMQIICGTGSNDTDYAIELTRYSCEVGADAALVVTPYYNKATQEGLIKHFTAIADSINIPVILYNVPGRTGCNILPETAVAINEACPNIIDSDSISWRTWIINHLFVFLPCHLTKTIRIPAGISIGKSIWHLDTFFDRKSCIHLGVML